MPKLSDAQKLIGAFFGFILVIFGAFWFPYRIEGVPEWKAQIVEESGRPITFVQVTQGWINPVDDGVVASDSRVTDQAGVVIFPPRRLKDRLLLGIFLTKPSAHIFVCFPHQYADVDWDGAASVPPRVIALKKGSCLYGWGGGQKSKGEKKAKIMFAFCSP